MVINSIIFGSSKYIFMVELIQLPELTSQVVGASSNNAVQFAPSFSSSQLLGLINLRRSSVPSYKSSRSTWSLNKLVLTYISSYKKNNYKNYCFYNIFTHLIQSVNLLKSRIHWVFYDMLKQYHLCIPLFCFYSDQTGLYNLWLIQLLFYLQHRGGELHGAS